MAAILSRLQCVKVAVGLAIIRWLFIKQTYMCIFQNLYQSKVVQSQLYIVAYDIICVHYDDVIMGTIASQITSLAIVYSIVYSGADLSKHQSSTSLAFVWVIHRGPVNYPHKWPVTRKIFPFDDVIICVLLVFLYIYVMAFRIISLCMMMVWGNTHFKLYWILNCYNLRHKHL